MRKKFNWPACLALLAIAVLIILMTVSFETDSYGKEAGLFISFLSDGCFTAAVLYLGCAILIFISEAGNFYGLQYLGYTVVSLVTLRKGRFEARKDYFTYCVEKQARQKEQGKSSVKWLMLIAGLICLILSLVFAGIAVFL
jgi:uncharacterized integral membrane protein